MNGKHSKYIRKKVRQFQYKFVTNLMGNMTFWDRVVFAFRGKYYEPLQNTLNKLQLKDVD